MKCADCRFASTENGGLFCNVCKNKKHTRDLTERAEKAEARVAELEDVIEKAFATLENPAKDCLASAEEASNILEHALPLLREKRTTPSVGEAPTEIEPERLTALLAECLNCGTTSKPLDREHCAGCICQCCKRTATECGESMANNDGCICTACHERRAPSDATSATVCDACVAAEGDPLGLYFCVQHGTGPKSIPERAPNEGQPRSAMTMLEDIIVVCAPDPATGKYDRERQLWEVEQIARHGLSGQPVIPYPGPRTHEVPPRAVDGLQVRALQDFCNNELGFCPDYNEADRIIAFVQATRRAPDYVQTGSARGGGKTSAMLVAAYERARNGQSSVLCGHGYSITMHRGECPGPNVEAILRELMNFDNAVVQAEDAKALYEDARELVVKLRTMIMSTGTDSAKAPTDG